MLPIDTDAFSLLAITLHVNNLRIFSKKVIELRVPYSAKMFAKPYFFDVTKFCYTELPMVRSQTD